MSGDQHSLLVEPPARCSWCGLGEATTLVYTSPTCLRCAVSREDRIAAYHDRLRRAAQPKEMR